MVTAYRPLAREPEAVLLLVRVRIRAKALHSYS